MECLSTGCQQGFILGFGLVSGPFKKGSTSRRFSLDWVLSENEAILHVGIFTLIWEVAETVARSSSQSLM